MIKGIIFDLDGTLLDTIADLAKASNLTMEDYGFPCFSNEEIKRKVGNGNVKLIERCLPEGQKHLLDEAVTKFYAHYADCYMDETRPYIGMPETLLKLQERGIMLCVNTNKQNLYCEELLKHNFPGVHFTKIIGSRDGVPNKPDPTSANELVELMGLSKEEVLYVGDSDVDLKTANNAGLTSVWVSWGFRTFYDVREQNPKHCIDLPSQLIDLI